MKKFRILMGALALAVVAAVIIACTKEKEAKVGQSNSDLVTVSKEDDMSAYLKQFKEKMQSADKGDEALSLEDARWHLEAVLNYSYGDAGYPTSDIHCDTFNYKFSTRGADITLAQLNEAFNSFSKNVEDAYSDCELPEKRILAIQTRFEDVFKDGGVSAQIILSIGGITTLYTWFDSTDYWNEWYYDYGSGWVDAGGKCGPYAGECLDSGAPLELTRKVNLRLPEHTCPHGFTGYYTDVFSGILSVRRSDFDTDFLFDANSPCHYKLYYRSESPHEPWASNPGGCICPEDMNYYLSKGTELIDHYQPEGMLLISAYYQSDVMVGVRDDNCFHELVLSYGVFHCGGGGIVN